MNKGKTIDEITGQPEGTFKKFIEEENKKLAKMEQERKDRIRNRKKI